jgi:hypothetical protein
MDARAWSAGIRFPQDSGAHGVPAAGAHVPGMVGRVRRTRAGALQRLPMRDEEAAHFARLFGGPYGQNEIFSE